MDWCLTVRPISVPPYLPESRQLADQAPGRYGVRQDGSETSEEVHCQQCINPGSTRTCLRTPHPAERGDPVQRCGRGDPALEPEECM